IVVTAMFATITRHDPMALKVQQLEGAQQTGLDTIKVLGQGSYAAAITPTLTSKPRVDITNALTAAANDPLHTKVDDLFNVSAATTKLWRVPETNVSNLVTARAQQLTTAAQNEQRNWMIVTIASILLSIVMLWLANKWITKPLRTLSE